MTFKQHVQTKYPDSYAVRTEKDGAKKREYTIYADTINKKKLGAAYSESNAWKEAMLKIEEHSPILEKNGLTKR